MTKNSRHPEKEWMHQFHEFVETRTVEVSSARSRFILDQVRDQLSPPVSRVLLKVGVTHLTAGALSLVFCPQLGVGPLGGGHGIMAMVMPLGGEVCAAFCGAVFLGFSSLVIVLLLRREELKCANAMGYFYVPVLSALSFTALMLMGGDGEKVTYICWLLGATIVGLALLKMGAFARLRIYPRLIA